MKNLIFCISIFVFSLSVSAQEMNIIPRPVDIQPGSSPKKPFILDQNTIIFSGDSSGNSANFLKEYVLKHYQLDLLITRSIQDIKGHNYINLSFSKNIDPNPDKYLITVSNKTINASSASEQGIFYAVQTIIQLLPTAMTEQRLSIPSIHIADYPRFAYRGMHLDVSRHFFDMEFVKKYIDFLALHKMNYFHWHLTDDQGWRIEIKKYPKLTAIGAWRDGSIVGLWPGRGNEGIRYQVLPTDVKITPKNVIIKTDGKKHGGFYTQNEIKDVIDYAAKRYITIIPEIEMPAHSMAVLAAYPEFGTEPNKKYE
ncbi:MAG: family 20 glycosylhydrolase, partial [Bacteroidia bacterium]